MIRKLILLAFLLGLTQSAHAAYARVRLCPSGGITGGNNSGTTVACGFASNGAGHILIVWSAAQTGTATATIADSPSGNTYTVIASAQVFNGMTLYVWAAYNAIASAGTNTITVTWNATLSHMYLGGSEYSGNATSNALDQTATASSSPTPAAPVSPNVTTTQGGELLIGIFAGGNGSNATVAAGSWTIIAATTTGCCSPGWEDQPRAHIKRSSLTQATLPMVRRTFLPM